MSNFVKRAISGLFFVVILTGCIFLHPLCFFVLFFIINILGLREFSMMARRMNVDINLPMLLICGSILFTAGFLHKYLGNRDGYLYFFIATFVLSIWELYRKKGNSFQNLSFSYYGLLYLSLPFTLLIYLPYMTNDEWRPEIIFFPFLLVWFNDTFAFLLGSQFGRHQTIPENISQKILGRSDRRRNMYDSGSPVHRALYRRTNHIQQYGHSCYCRCIRYFRRLTRIHVQKKYRNQRFRKHHARSRRHTRPF